MAFADIIIPMEGDLINKFNDKCNDLGVNETAVISALVNLVINKGHLPAELEVEPDPFYSIKNTERLKKSIANLEAGGGTYHDVIEVDDAEEMG